MPEDIVVIGAGGFGREVLDVVRAINASQPEPAWEIVGVLDDAPTEENLLRLKQQSVPCLGDVRTFVETHPATSYVIGIGSPAARRTVADRVDKAGWRAATLVHPAATLGFGVSIGTGTIVCAGARVTTNIKVGRHVHLDTNVTVGHDTVLGDFVRMNPASSVSGDCVIKDGALIGVGATVLNGTKVGGWATVGGSACVVRDVAAEEIVVGVPARPLVRGGS